MVCDLTLCLGSNCSPRFVEEAIEWLGHHIHGVRSSGLYRTMPLKGYGEPYCNAVVAGSTEMTEMQCTRLFKQYELDSGRDSACRAAGKVPIDIDIVIWNGSVVRERDYTQDYFKIGYARLNF